MPGECKHQDLRTDIVYADVCSIKETEGLFKMTTSKAIMNVTQNQPFEIIRYRRLHEDWITPDMPLRGKFSLLLLKVGSKFSRYNRYNIVLSLISNRKDMLVTTYKPYIGRDTNICDVIAEHINRSFKKKRSVILIGTDTLGSLIKKYDDTIRVNRTQLQRLYIPDTLLYNAVRSKIDFIESNQIAKGKPAIKTNVEAKTEPPQQAIVESSEIIKFLKTIKTSKKKFLIAMVLVILLLIIIIPMKYNLIKLMFLKVVPTVVSYAFSGTNRLVKFALSSILSSLIVGLFSSVVTIIWKRLKSIFKNEV
jgi:hypothetical protein